MISDRYFPKVAVAAGSPASVPVWCIPWVTMGGSTVCTRVDGGPFEVPEATVAYGSPGNVCLVLMGCSDHAGAVPVKDLLFCSLAISRKEGFFA